MARISSFRETGERYPFLRVVATFSNAIGVMLLLLAALVLVIGVAALVYQLSGPVKGPVGIIAGAGILWSLGFLAAGIQCLAVGSFFRLAIQIEENTRATAQALERLNAQRDPKPTMDPISAFLS